jgi:hypothetical protein
MSKRFEFKNFDVKTAIRRRRDRRMQRNLGLEGTVRRWAEEHGFALGIHNDGHHWVFKKGDIFVEWWPSSAKLALNRDYLQTVHAHDWPQVLARLTEPIQKADNPSCYLKIQSKQFFPKIDVDRALKVKP